MTDTFHRPLRRASPGETTGRAGDQPGAVPILSSPPAYSDLPTDDNGNAVGMVFHDTTDDVTKLALPDGSGSVTTGTLLDLSANVSLGSNDVTGLL